MKETERKNIIELPYSLHDSHINRIVMKSETIEMYFRDGYYVLCDSDTKLIKGSLQFQNVDFTFCKVSILKTDGRDGAFRGKKYSLKKYIKKHKKFDMEIINETYGYNQSKFSGYIYKGKKVKEFMIEIYHFGKMKYITKE